MFMFFNPPTTFHSILAANLFWPKKLDITNNLIETKKRQMRAKPTFKTLQFKNIFDPPG